MTGLSGTDQFESISHRFANLLEINVIIFNISFKKKEKTCKYPTERSRLMAGSVEGRFAVFWSWLEAACS